jgi:hypothetical protein
MGGNAWVDTFYSRTRREQARREHGFNKMDRTPVFDRRITNPQTPAQQTTHSSEPRTRFDRILDTDEVPSVSSKPSTPLLGSTRFDRILRDDED